MSRFRTLSSYFLLLSVSFAEEPLGRFAWLSDTHVGSSTGREDLSLAMHDINGMRDIEFTVLSGDITETGKGTDLELAKAILDSLNKPYYIVPGNHDTKWSESGFTRFSQLWGSDKFVFEFSGFRFIGLHQGPLMRMGDGHFSPEDLRWLDSVLVTLPVPRQPLVFVTHYPVDSSIDNWYELLDRVKGYNTKAILVGHGHRNDIRDFEGVPGVMGRSTLRREDATGGYTIVEIRRDSLLFFERTTGGETGPAWHRLSLEERHYLSEREEYPRPDFSINRQYPRVHPQWVYETDFTIASAPAVWDGYAVVGNSRGAVYGISLAEGVEKWRFKSKGPVYSSPDISRGKVVFGSADSSVYCVDVVDGDPVWSVGTGAPVVAAPVIKDGVVYVGGSDGIFRAIDLEKGDLIWEFEGLGGFVETRPLVYGGNVIFGAWDTYLYALDKGDGSLVWKWSNGNPGVLYSPAACWPVGSYNKVFIVAPDRYMTAIDVETAKNVWRTGGHDVREAIGLSENGEIVYARSMWDTLFAYSTSASEPEILWASDCGYGYDIDPSMPVERDGIVFFGTKNGFVIAVDARTGEVRWKHRTGVALVNTVAPIDSQRVVVTDMDGRIILLEEQ
ncbi:MAG: PQQ-binding-like beta-propeller repeat protein [Fidelibacterota bacterium]